MRKDNIKRCVKEAKEFIKRAKEVLAELDKENSDRVFSGTKASGALKRQSMELSRSLADLRRS